MGLPNTPHLLMAMTDSQAVIGAQYSSRETLDSSSSMYKQCRNTNSGAQAVLRLTSSIFLLRGGLASTVFLIRLKIDRASAYF